MGLMQALALMFPLLRPDPSVLDAIERAATERRVPRVLLAAVCVAESGAGHASTPAVCGVLRPRGVPRDAQADAAAATLSRLRAACGSWPGALRAFRYGGCGHPDRTRYVRRVQRLAAGIERAERRLERLRATLGGRTADREIPPE